MNINTDINQTKSSTFLSIIWVLLVALTVLSFYLGETGQSGRVVMMILLTISMLKSQLIAHYFMGLNKAGLIWQSVMFLFFVIVGGLIALAYMMGEQ